MFRVASLIAISLCASPSLAQTSDQLFTATPEQLAVTKVIIAQENAWNRGDLDGYLAHFKDAADTQLLLGVPVRGMANVRAQFRLNFPNKEAMGALEDSEVEVRELGERFAVATGKYKLTRSKKGGGPAEGTFTEIFEKTPGGWRVVFNETT